MTPDTRDPVTPLTAEEEAAELLRLLNGPRQEDHTHDPRPGWFECHSYSRSPAIREDCDCGAYRRFQDDADELAQRMARRALAAARQTPGAEAELDPDVFDRFSTAIGLSVLAGMPPSSRDEEVRIALSDARAIIAFLRAALQAAPVSIDRERLADFATRMADTILDRPFADPDDDLAKLAREFFRTDWTASHAE